MANVFRQCFVRLTSRGQYFLGASKRGMFALSHGHGPGVRTFSKGVHRHQSVIGGGRVPTDMQRKMLVKAKIFETDAAIPPEVSNAQIQKAANWFRIRTANRMMLAFLVGCIIFITLGRKDRDKGLRIMDTSNEWIAEQKRIGEQKRADEKSSD